MATAPTLFFDVGGVLLSDGWDTATREKAVAAFGLDPVEFQARHEMLRYGFDTGRHSLDHYVDWTVFHRPRPFSRDDFRRFMFDQSVQLGDTLDFVRTLAGTGRYRMFTLNNESRELHEYRVARFGLADVFRGFLTSCYLGQAKPDEEIYRNALGIAACPPGSALFLDDRAMNVEAAEAAGLLAHRFAGLDDLRGFLADRGVSA